MLNCTDFSDYGVFSEAGFLVGIREDAPEDIKKEYAAYLKLKEEAAKEGIKL
jgi:hypothetical protein